MYAVSSAYLAALRASHSIRTRVDCYSAAGVLLASDLPIESGSVAVDASSAVRRQLDVTIGDPTLAPAAGDVGALLAPYGNELYVRSGMAYPDGTIEWVPLGWFRINEAQAAFGVEGVKVTAADRSVRIADAKFQTPFASNTALTIPAQIAALMTSVFACTVTDLTGVGTVVPRLVAESDRWALCDDLAKGIGAEVFFDANGVAIIRATPQIGTSVAWYVDTGPQGVMISGSRETSRSSTYNVVIVQAEPVDGTAPIRYVANDTDPASPTYYLGGFGQVPYALTSASITTSAQAQVAATALLARTKGLTRSVSLTSVPNYALEAGDVIQVVFTDGTYERHIIDSLTFPLTPNESMPISTRSTDPTKE